jgi:phospholipid transport system transporter-binding protein
MPKFTLKQTEKGHYTLQGQMTFAGIDASSVQSLNLVSGTSQVTIDFSQLEASDSVGLALMIEWIKQCRANDTRLVFTHLPTQLVTLAKLSGLDTYGFFS